MRVAIGSIRNQRGAFLDLSFNERLPSPLNLNGEKSLPVHVKVKVTNTGQRYRVEGTMRTTVELPCDRCLKTCPQTIDVEFEEHFRTRHYNEPLLKRDDWEYVDDDAPPSDEDDDNVFDGDSFTLDQVVRDYLLLALPTKVMCEEGCLGLCPQCGQNQNESECTCPTEAIDPRLAGLADLFKEE